MQQTECASKIDPVYKGSRVGHVRSMQLAQGDEPCFMTNKRLLCREEHCEWKNECRRLVAVWRR